MLIDIFKIHYYICPERYDTYILIKEYLRKKIIWNLEKCVHTNDLLDHWKLLIKVYEICLKTLNEILKQDKFLKKVY